VLRPRPTDRWIVRKEYTRVRLMTDGDADDPASRLTRKMQEYASWYRDNPADLFFHRKSGRVVLAILHLEFNGRSEYVRGINSEVSLPTGSVCAERACIVKARSDFPEVTRENMKGIAVLEVPMGEESLELNNPLPPCGACREWLEKIQEKSQGFYVLTFPDLSFSYVHERFLFWSEDQESTQPQDFGPWICWQCNAQNVPLSRECRDCSVSRFALDYNRVPTEQRFFDVLDVLKGAGALQLKAIKKKLDTSGCPQNDVELARTLKRLMKNERTDEAGGVYGKLIGQDEVGNYHVTETGIHILRKWRDRKKRARAAPS